MDISLFPEPVGVKERFANAPAQREPRKNYRWSDSGVIYVTTLKTSFWSLEINLKMWFYAHPVCTCTYIQKSIILHSLLLTDSSNLRDLCMWYADRITTLSAVTWGSRSEPACATYIATVATLLPCIPTASLRSCHYTISWYKVFEKCTPAKFSGKFRIIPQPSGE